MSSSNPNPRIRWFKRASKKRIDRHRIPVVEHLESRRLLVNEIPTLGGDTFEPVASFGNAGEVQFQGAWARAHQLSGGRIAVTSSGSDNESTWNYSIDVFREDGTRDTTVGSNGRIVLDLAPGSADAARGMCELADGSMLVVGDPNYGYGQDDWGIAKLNPNGSLDTTFGTAGTVIYDVPSFGLADSVDVLDNGQIIVVGKVNQSRQLGVLRLNANGGVDTSFGSNGLLVIDLGNSGDNSVAYSKVIPSSNGSFFVKTGREYQAALPKQSILLKIEPDGTISKDTRLGLGSEVRSDDIVVDRLGRMLVVGTADSDVFVARYTANGDLDSSFGTDGILRAYATNFVASASGIAILRDGSVLVSYLNDDGQQAIIRRLLETGSFDSSFGDNGFYNYNFGTRVGGDHQWLDLLAMQNGNLWIGSPASGWVTHAVSLSPKINDLFIDEVSSQQVVSLNGITAGGSESQPLRVTASSSNTALIPNPSVSYTSPNTTGSIAFTPVADQLGTAMITVTVEDAGLDNDLNTTSDNLTFNRLFTVNINPVNDPPTLDPVGDLTIAEDTTLQTVNLTGITAGGADSQPLRVTASSSNTALIPNPTVTYTSPNTTGSIAFTPIDDQFGSSIITVTVEDGGVDGKLSTTADNSTTSRSFTVTVTPVNDPPIFTGGNSFEYLSSVSLDTASYMITDDFNNDGIDDIAAAHWNAGGISIVLDKDGTGFVEAIYIQGTNSAEIRSADLDGDGDSDLVVATPMINALTVYKNDGTGHFSLFQLVGTGSNVWNVGLGDFDRDGDTDAAVSDNNGTLFVLTNDGTGTMGISAVYPVQQQGEVETADYDNDGWIDIATTDLNSGFVSIFYNDHSGAFQLGQTIRTGSRLLWSMRAGDFNGDGRLDLAIADGNAQSIRILSNQGSRVFSVGDNYPLNSPVNRVHIADFNRDGIDDILTTTWDTLWAISPKYKDTISTPVTPQSGAITAGDFDHDGILDIATTNNSGANQLEIRRLRASLDEALPINSPTQTVGLRNITAGGGESQTLRVTATSNNTTLVPDILVSYNSPDTTGTFSFTPATDQFGTAIITVTVEDAGLDNDLNTTSDNLTFNRLFTVTVNSANEKPTLDPISDLTITEDSPERRVNLRGITAGGGESQSLRVTASSSNTSVISNLSVTYTSPRTIGSIAFTPIADQVGSTVIMITVEDGGLDGDLSTVNDNASTSKSFTVTVYAVNDSPNDIVLSSTSIFENAGTNAVVGEINTTDPDQGDTFTYMLVAGSGDTDNAAFNIDGNRLRVTNNFNYEAKSSYSVRIRSTDQGLLSFEKTFLITVLNRNELISVTVNGADNYLNPNQRSQVTSLVVVTESLLVNSLSTFGLINIGLFSASSMSLATSQIIVTNVGSVYTLRFGSGSGVVTRNGTGTRGNSLVDGNWILSISSTEISGANQYGNRAIDNFFRMFGDSDGDGDVDGVDTVALRRAQVAGYYNAAMDWNGDGIVAAGLDIANFASNLNKRRRLF